MNITNFVSSFQGGARLNLYEVVVSGLPEKLKFLAKATSLPGRDLGVIEVRYLNHVIPYRGDVTFQDWHVTIMLDQDWAVKKELDEWFEKIQSSDTIVGSGHLLDYTETAQVTQLSTTGEPIATYEMYHLWPYSLPSLELGFDNADTIGELDVIFKFSYYKRIS